MVWEVPNNPDAREARDLLNWSVASDRHITTDGDGFDVALLSLCERRAQNEDLFANELTHEEPATPYRADPGKCGGVAGHRFR